VALSVGGTASIGALIVVDTEALQLVLRTEVKAPVCWKALHVILYGKQHVCLSFQQEDEDIF